MFLCHIVPEDCSEAFITIQQRPASSIHFCFLPTLNTQTKVAKHTTVEKLQMLTINHKLKKECSSSSILSVNSIYISFLIEKTIHSQNILKNQFHISTF